MKKIKIYFGFTFLLLTSCSNNYINDYGEFLDINFPKNIEQVYFNQKNYFQDYINFSVYHLTKEQNDSLLLEITPKICDSINIDKCDCWIKNDDVYSFKSCDTIVSNEYSLEVIVTSKNNIYTLLIRETKQ